MANRINRPECRRLRAEGWTLDRLKARYGVSRPAVSIACRGVVCGIDHSRARVEVFAQEQAAKATFNNARIRALYAAGRAPKQIAFETGLSLDTVYRHLPPIHSPLVRKHRASASVAPTTAGQATALGLPPC